MHGLALIPEWNGTLSTKGLPLLFTVYKSAFFYSRVVEDWINDRCNLQISILEHWKTRIKVLQRRFAVISFMHIFRIFNLEVDGLSKRGIGIQQGLISYEEIVLGQVVSEGSIKAF